MILKAFQNVGDSFSIADAYALLIALYSNSPHSKEKAAGSLGGAVNGGTLIRNGNIYTRVR